MFGRIFGNNNNAQGVSAPAASTSGSMAVQNAQTDTGFSAQSFQQSPPVADPIQSPPIPQQAPVVEPYTSPSIPSTDVPVTVPQEPQEEVPPPAPPQPEIKPAEPVTEVPQVAIPQEPAPLPPEQKVTDILIDEEYKNKIGLQLTEAMLKGIDDGNMTESEMGVISCYILDNIDAIHNHTELNIFLQSLAQRWSVFKQVQKAEKGVEKVGEDSAKAEEIAGLLHENKLDDALKMAENAASAIN